MRIELPWPPTVNTYWRRHGHTIYLSNKGRAYRENVVAILAGMEYETFADDVSVTVHAYPPDKRKRDIDNIAKGILDSLAHAKVYVDDSQVTHLEMWKHEKVKGGTVLVTIEEIQE